MKIGFSEKDEQFRQQIEKWLEQHLTGEFTQIKFRGGPGDEHMFFAERKQWELKLANGKWTCIGWPQEFGGRACSIEQQVIFHEEYARAGGPGRVGHIGEGLIGPTIIEFGTEEQKQRFLPQIISGEELWCQGYSEPGAGSDLANIATKAKFDTARKKWLISGQKVWTSLAKESDWCFVLARTESHSKGKNGLSFFLVNMKQSQIEVRPINQMTGTSEFNEVFFEDAECETTHIVGEIGQGWQVAMGLLGFERGVSTLGQQMLFQNELNNIVQLANKNGAGQDPIIRQRLADAHIGLKIMRYNALRTLSSDSQLQQSALISKLYWSNWHRNLGNLAIDVLGTEGNINDEGDYQLTPLQALFLFTRADTIYGGTNQIQRNIIAERALGLPREARPV